MSNELSFDEIVESSELKASLAKQGFAKPTDVQAQALPILNSGKDAIILSKRRFSRDSGGVNRWCAEQETTGSARERCPYCNRNPGQVA